MFVLCRLIISLFELKNGVVHLRGQKVEITTRKEMNGLTISCNNNQYASKELFLKESPSMTCR